MAPDQEANSNKQVHIFFFVDVILTRDAPTLSGRDVIVSKAYFQLKRKAKLMTCLPQTKDFENMRFFTHFSLDTPKRVIGKQCRPRLRRLIRVSTVYKWFGNFVCKMKQYFLKILIL